MNRALICLATLLSFIQTNKAALCSAVTSEGICDATTGCTWLNAACRCSSEVKLDILFGVDTSGSIGYDGFQIQKEFISGLVDRGISDDARIGFIMFSTQINATEPIREWTSKTELTNFVDGMYWTAGWTNTPMLITQAISDFQDAYEPDRQKVFMLITDGNPCLPDSQGGCPQNVCDKETIVKAAGIRTIIIGVGDGLNTKYVQCLCQSSDDFIPVASFSDEDFDSVLGSLSDVLCPITKELKFTEIKAHKKTNTQNFRTNRFVELYNTGVDIDLAELTMSGLISVSGTFPSTTVLQGQYLVFYDGANDLGDLGTYSSNMGSDGVVTCHLCPTAVNQCDLSECSAGAGDISYAGFCWCDNSVYVACGNTASSSCTNRPTNNPYGSNVVNGCGICTFNDAMTKTSFDITLTDTVGSLPIDSITYDSSTWQTADDGYSYELINKGFDNQIGGNWRQTCSIYGTPGADPAAQCTEECLVGGCGAGVCLSGTKQCDCGTDTGLYPVCLDTTGAVATGCTKCAQVPPVDTCTVAFTKNGTSRYAKFDWSESAYTGLKQYQITYFQSGADPLVDNTYANVYITNNYDPGNTSYNGFVQTSILECTGCAIPNACDPLTDTCTRYFSDKTLCVVVTASPTNYPTPAPTASPTQAPTNIPTASPTLACPYTFWDNDDVCTPERCSCNEKQAKCCLLNPDFAIVPDPNRAHETVFACRIDEQLVDDSKRGDEAAAGISPGYLLTAKQHSFNVIITSEPEVAADSRSVYPCMIDIYWRLKFASLSCDYGGDANSNCDPNSVSLANAGLAIDTTSGWLKVYSSADVLNATVSFVVSRLACNGTVTNCYDNVAIYGDLEIVNATPDASCHPGGCNDNRIYPMRIPVYYNYAEAFVAPPGKESEIPQWLYWIIAALVVFLAILALLLYKYWWKNKATGAALGSTQEELDAAVMEQEDGFGADLGNNAVGFNPLATGFNPNAPAGAVGPNAPPNGQGGGANFIKPNVEKTVYRQDYGAQMGNLR